MQQIRKYPKEKAESDDVFNIIMLDDVFNIIMLGDVALLWLDGYQVTKECFQIQRMVSLRRKLPSRFFKTLQRTSTLSKLLTNLQDKEPFST